MSPAIIVALCSLIAAGISALVTYLLGRKMAKAEPKRAEADAQRLFAEAYNTLVGDLGAQNRGLKLRVDELKEELELRIAESAELERRIEVLEKENQELKALNKRLKECLDNGGG